MKSRSVGIFLIAAACMVSFAIGLEAAETQPALTIERNGDEWVAIKIHDPEGKPVVTLRPDGTVEAAGTPAEASKAFWAALSGYIKTCSKL